MYPLLTPTSAMPDVSKAVSETKDPGPSPAQGAPRGPCAPGTREPGATGLTRSKRMGNKRRLARGVPAATSKPAALGPRADGMDPIRRFGDG